MLNGRYRLVYRLGAGGMGSVWLADDTLLERSVALKELLRHAGESDWNERRDPRGAGGQGDGPVRHPAIVPIHDFFFIDGDPWIVMEYISGRSLNDIIRSGAAERADDRQDRAARAARPDRGAPGRRGAPRREADQYPGRRRRLDIPRGLRDRQDRRRPVADRASVIGTPEFLAPERFSGTRWGRPPMSGHSASLSITRLRATPRSGATASEAGRPR